MDINGDTAISAVGGVGGSAGILAFLKSWYNEYMARQEKKEIQMSIDKLAEELDRHVILDAQTYATRDDMRSLFNHIDKKFENMQTMLMGILRDGNRKNN